MVLEIRSYPPGECPPELDHRWAEFESWVTSGRFCTRCDREEWTNGVVRPGWRYSS